MNQKVTKYTDAPVTLEQFKKLLERVGYKYSHERGPFLIWKLVKNPGPKADGSSEAVFVSSKPYFTSNVPGGPPGEFVFDSNEVADALIYITGDGPFEVVDRIKGVLDE